MKIQKTIYSLLLLSFCSTIGFSQKKMAIDDILNIKRIGNPEVSPDKKLIVYDITTISVEENKGNKNIVIGSIENHQAKEIASGTFNEFGAKFIENGTKIIYLSTEKNGAQLFTMNVDGSNKQQVSEIENGINEFCVSADGKKIAFTSDVKTGKDIHDIYPDLPKTNARIIDDLYYRNWDSWDDYYNSHVFVASFENGKVSGHKDINLNEKFDAEGVSFSADGNFLTYHSKKQIGKSFALSTNTDIFLVDLKSFQAKNISEGRNGYDKDAKFSQDGKSIIWGSMPTAGYESDRVAIIQHDIATSTSKELFPKFEEGVENISWSTDGKKVFFTAPENGTDQIFVGEIATAKVSKITKEDADYTYVIPCGDFLIANKMSISRPIDIYKIDLKSNTENKLTAFNDDLLSKIKMGKVEKNWISTSDGKKELVWVIFPSDFDETKKYPALLYCQGGPQSAVSQFFSYRWNFQLMAANDYIVVAPNRRGLPGFGRKWNDDIAQNWGGQAINDYYSAIDSIAKRPYINKNKLGAVGASYGGYSVYFMAGNHNKRFKTFIAHCGLFNLESWYTMTDEMFFSNHDIGKPYWESENELGFLKNSPHKFVKNWDTPLLVIHNEKDFRVPISEGMQAFGAAQLKNIPSRFLYIPDEGHWVLKPQNSILWNRVFFDWLNKTLKN
jgi:dipeptidyl aminopeptidase/acylaminoacyl peptidase